MGKHTACSIKLSLALMGLILGALSWSSSFAAETVCPEFLNHEYRKLHSQKTVNLCELYKNKPLIIVNTASHCGFTKQFGDLEALYKKYQAQGLEIIGFASNDFKQEDKSEEKAASICYENYGVTFTMLAPTHVKGKDSNPTFVHLNAKTQAPSWNFNKYLVSADGATIKAYGSRVKPLDSELEEDLRVYF